MHGNRIEAQVDERRREQEDADWYEFRRNNADLFATGSDSILSRYYEPATLGDQKARDAFVLPDKRND